MSATVHVGQPCTDECNHGSVSTYCNHGCRCQPCRDAFAAAHMDYRRRVAADRREDPATQHGTDSTYTNYWCRCAPCKTAHAAYSRSYAARSRASA